jgi:hypothetical protein
MVKAALSGQFDALYYNETTALVIDYKSGFSEPDPAEINAQLKVLAVLAALHLPQVIEVYAQIISGPYGVTEARYTIQELAHAYNEILDTLRAIHAESAPFSPSVSACKWCPGSNICQAIKNLTAPIARLQLNKLPLESDRAGRLLDEIEILRGHFEEIEKFYYNYLSDNPSAHIKNYALVPNAPRREIIDIENTKKRLAEFLDPAELDQASSLKIGDLEKLFGKKAKLKGAAVRQEFNKLLHGLITEKVPDPSLKRVKTTQLAELTL